MFFVHVVTPAVEKMQKFTNKCCAYTVCVLKCRRCSTKTNHFTDFFGKLLKQNVLLITD